MTHRLLASLKVVDRGLMTLERAIVVFLLFLSAGVLVVDVALRNLFHASLPWAPELTRYAIVWMVFIGASLGARAGAHISIDILSEILPPRLSLLVLRISAIIATTTCVVMAYFGIQLVILMYGFRQTSPSLLWPMWAVFLAIPVGFGLMAIRFIQFGFTLTAKEKNALPPAVAA